MKLTIFSRLLIGYLLIFVLAIGMSAYAISKIGQVNEVTQSILMINNRMTDSSEKLSDILFSQVRYEKKYFISKDEVFYDEFLRLEKDFDRHLGEMTSIEDSPSIRNFLNSIKTSYEHYRSLLHDELKYLKSKTPYSHQEFNREREKAVHSIIDELKKLKADTQQNTHAKIKTLHDIGREWRSMAILMTGAFLLLGIIISLLIHRSIAQPLSTLERKTKEISQGIFRGDLHLSSPPELAGLANAFNLMCHKLSELDKMKSDFFSSVAHELRTPLSTIKMGISLLVGGQEGPITEGQKDLLTILEKENHRLIGLVNSLLDLSKMEAGMMSFHLEPRPIVPLIDQVIKEMGPLIEAQKIDLEVKVMEGLPVVKIDSERILQVVRNIIGNATRFTPYGGRVRISVRAINHGVEVSVSDTGPGIPAENLVTIFEKFKQASHPESYSMRGTGLGLAIAKQIITQHGGQIWAESKGGHGSTFFFVLPA